ncbi:MAG: OB-fold nucleic acid binding domain-containing protein, partial [Sphingomicrobium sp.]
GRGGLVLRLGLRQIEGLRLDTATRIVGARGDMPYASVEEVRRRSGASVATVERLAEADAFRSMKLDRRQALWDSRALKQAPDLPLFAAAQARDEGWETEQVRLPAMPLSEHVVSDYQTVRLSLKAHPMTFLRDHYAGRGFVTASELRSLRYGRRVSLAGLVLIRQRPGSAKGVCFITLEDETGIANLVVWPDAFAAQRSVVMGARLMTVHGMVQHDEAPPDAPDRSGPSTNIVHVIARTLEDDTAMLRLLSADALPSTLSASDGAGAMRAPTHGQPRDAVIVPKSRDFH